MSQDSTSYTISNEHIFLIDILRRMYNDNIQQINSMTSSINNLRNTNTQIRNILVQALLYPNTSFNRDNSRTNRSSRANRTSRTSRIDIPTYSTTTQRQTLNQTGNLGRVILDNVPYVIDSIQQYTIPIRQENTNNTNRSERTNNFSRLMQNFFEPIEIYPTHSQIEAATRNVRYSDILNPVNRSCPISLEPFNDNDIVSVIRFCSHIFKREELTTWFRTNCRCPVCRYDIRNYNRNTSSENIEDIGSSTDASNNYVDENESSEISEERNDTQSIETNTITRPNTTNLNTNTRDTITTYLDLILDNTLTDLSHFSDSDTSTLFTLLNTLQRR